jgi:hypothetical protein
MIMRLFLRVNALVMYIAIIGLAITIFIGIWNKQN